MKRHLWRSGRAIAAQLLVVLKLFESKWIDWAGLKFGYWSDGDYLLGVVTKLIVVVVYVLLKKFQFEALFRGEWTESSTLWETLV